jgi:hypothetical protein
MLMNDTYKGRREYKEKQVATSRGDGPSHLGKLKVALQFGPSISSISSASQAHTW